MNTYTISKAGKVYGTVEAANETLARFKALADLGMPCDGEIIEVELLSKG